MPGPPPPVPAPGPAAAGVRWAVFTTLAVPIALLTGTAALAGATGAALGLMAVAAGCRILLRRTTRRPAGAGPARRPSPIRASYGRTPES
ncbi:hypothetical protein ACFWPV_26825 [Streptomyces uncialis]|uniref:hypothetical protein n=1 Tax=Streptomyces uncialis TaxID=1048205 RepID=UPI003662ADFA